MKLVLRIISFILIFSANINISFAETMCEFPDNFATNKIAEIFSGQVARGCFQSDTCTDDICLKAKKILSEKMPVLFSDKLIFIAEGISQIQTDTISTINDSMYSQSDVSKTYIGISKKLEITLSSTDALSASNLIVADTATWPPGGTYLYGGTDYEFNIDQFLTDECDGSVAQNCKAAYSIVRVISTASKLNQELLLKLYEENITQTSNVIQQQDTAWQNYILNSRAIFPWELSLNEFLIPARDENLLLEGFVFPPKKQILFLHPYAGISFNDETDEFNPTLLMDLIGIYKWSDSDSIFNHFGASLAASWTEGSDIGLGLALHFKKGYSIAVTRNNNTTLINLSLEIGNSITNKQAQVHKFKGKAESLYRD